jgi:hypothetical protein
VVGILAAIASLAVAASASGGSRYATTPAVEPDRCATAWVIRRYVDPQATFEFRPEGEMPEGAIPFDLPDAELRRDARRATLEVLIEREHLSDPFVLELGRLVHDVEIGAWARPADAPSIDFERRLMAAVLAAPDPASALAACFGVLDALRSKGFTP